MTSRHTTLPLVHAAFLASVSLALGACGGGSGGEPSPDLPSPPEDAAASGDGDPRPDTTGVPSAAGGETNALPDTPSGTDADIGRYGVIAVGDENGFANADVIASFSRLSRDASPEAFGAALDPSADACTVGRNDGRPDLMLASALYLPTPAGIALESIGAGEAVLLSSDGGSWSELQGQPSDRFYTRPASDMSLVGAVPEGLVANVTGDAFPAFTDAAFGDVTPLGDVDHAGRGDVSRDTRFTWRPSGRPDARVRIETTSAASFFDDRGISLSCLVPDTGEFAFSGETRAALGADFIGVAPDFSRVVIRSVRDGDALLVLVRESFLVP